MTCETSLDRAVLDALADGSCIQCGEPAEDNDLLCARCREWLRSKPPSLSESARLMRLREALEEGA